MDILATFLRLLDNRRQLKDFAFERAWPASPGRTCRGRVATSVQLLDVALSLGCRDSAKPVALPAAGSALVMPMEMIPGLLVFWNRYPRQKRGLMHTRWYILKYGSPNPLWRGAKIRIRKANERSGRSHSF